MKPQPRYKPGDKIGGRYQVHKAPMGVWGKSKKKIGRGGFEPPTR